MHTPGMSLWTPHHLRIRDRTIRICNWQASTGRVELVCPSRSGTPCIVLVLYGFGILPDVSGLESKPSHGLGFTVTIPCYMALESAYGFSVLA